MTLSMMSACLVALAFVQPSSGFLPSSAARMSPCMTAQTSSAPPAATTSRLLDGEWVGWECRFSHTTGARMPIPEDYLPDSMREWDQFLYGFEVFVSDQERDGKVLYRKRAQVFPETGCSLDHLSLEMRTSEKALDAAGTTLATFNGGYALVEPAPFGGTHTVEVVVRTSDDTRVRCLAFVDHDAQALSRAITVAKERRHTSAFDDGDLYKGGLDIKTLTDVISAKCFAEYDPAPEQLEEQGGKALALRGGVIVRAGPWQYVQQHLSSGANGSGGGGGDAGLVWGVAFEVPSVGADAAAVVGVGFDAAGTPRVVA